MEEEEEGMRKMNGTGGGMRRNMEEEELMAMATETAERQIQQQKATPKNNTPNGWQLSWEINKN
jgi:hypothetical protein